MDVKNISFQILFILCWLSPGLFAQSFDFHTYSVGEGLAQSQVYALLEDQRGYIWMGTQGGGLSRFDGHDFRNFSTANTPGLSNNYLLSLYEDREGRLWMGTKSGLSRFDGISFSSYPLSSETAVEVYEVLQTQDGTLWVASSQGLFRWQDTQFVALDPSLGAPQGKISCLLESSEGQLYLGHQEGLSRQLADGTFEEVPQTGLINREIISLLEAPNGALWVGTLGGGLHQFEGERFYPLPAQDGLRNAVIFDLLYDKNGNLWIATLNQGAAIRSARDSSMSFLSDLDGLPRTHIRCLLEDEWGNLWLGTSGGGVSKYFGQEFFHYDRSDGLGARSIYSVGQDTLGRYWMGVYNRGFSIYDGERFVAHDRRNGFKNVQVKAILQDQRGRMWLGTYGQGLSLFLNDSTYTDFTFAQGLSDAYVWDLAEDSKGNIWVATAGGGINRLHPVADSTDSLHTKYEINSFRQSDGLPQDRINCLHIDSLDRVWFGTANRGIGYIDQDSARLTLSLPGSISDNSVRSMIEDEAGFLWLGTAGGGVHRLNMYAATDSLEFIPFREGLTSDNIYLLGLDEAQQLWIGTESGVDRASLGPDRNIIEIRHYGQSEGFVGIEVCQNAVHRDPAGHLWFGTINGLTHYNPRSTIQNPLPPRLSWEEISLFYTPLQEVEKYQSWVQDWGMVQSGLQLPYNQNTLSFDFIGIDHQNPDQVRYQWKLTELETDWRPVTHQSSATYAQLPPGDYTFLVRAVNGDGVWTTVPMEVAFSIQPPYWQSWWFRAAALGVIALLVGLGLKIRVDQVRRNAREETQRLEMEKDLLGLEQKALRLQMNPHFIFHALNSIQSLISQQDAQTARYFLAKFARLMRSVLENSRDSMIPLAAEIQMLEDYLSLEIFSRHDQFDYRVELDDWIDPEALMIPPMLLQPFVENAIIHGVAHLEHKGRIRLRFERIGQHIECLITDNGIGREAASKLSSQQNHHQKSTALMVIQERLDILHRGEEAKGWDKSIEIRDLADPAGKPIGTQVLVRIPIEES